jgi:hypothetical protein
MGWQIRKQGGIGAGLIAATIGCLALGMRGHAVSAAPATPLFLRDIAPILDKKGCSVAACHGKFGGRGGFQVSLLTLSPQDDYDPIVRGARGRRVNLMDPDKSLLLLKATGQVSHVGGKRFEVGSREYNLLRTWIAAGAPYDPDADPKLAKLSVTPGEAVLPGVGGTVKLHVVAHFTDGSAQDVTPYAMYDASDPAVLAVDGNGVVTGKRWGGAAVVVRYLGTVQSASLTLPRADKTPYPKVAGVNFVDDFVQANLRKMNVVPSRLSTDREFVRRVYLDVCGKLPEPAESESFVADTTPGKRARLIDKLLDTPEYADLQTLRLGDLFRINPGLLGNNIGAQRGAALFTDWVRDAVANNLPYDQFARQLILARGSTYRSGPSNFYLVARSPQDRMETVSQAFLGQRMACARCHKHPFDRWTTDDYWNFAAFMGKVGTRGGRLVGEQEVFYDPAARVVNDSVTGHRGQVAQPTFLGDAHPMLAVGRANGNSDGNGLDPNYIGKLADWMVSPENPYFARATVNRLWSHYLGRGVVQPVDDMRVTSPPAVPGLLEALSKDFVATHYDVKHTIRVILNSRTYQTASEVNATNKLDDKFFSHFYPRPMLGQVFLDALNAATGSRQRFGEFPPETRSVQLTLPVNSDFLDTFGRSHREFLADLDPKVEPTLIQTLHLLNSSEVDDKVRASGGTVDGLLKRNLTNNALIDSLYLKTFCRLPSPKETTAAAKYLESTPNRAEGAQDLMWALISAREFYFVS